MNNKEQQRRVVHEVLVILGILALLTFICRLWPILLLIFLAIIIAALRLVFLSSRKVEVIPPLPLLEAPSKEPTEKDVRDLAYSVIQKKITELVSVDYPDARWVWEQPNSKEKIEKNEPVYILLNRAGGYRRAQVHILNLQVTAIKYDAVEDKKEDQEESDITENENDDTSKPKEPIKVNYELLAFEWVEAHIFEINDRCNDAIGEGRSELRLTSEELPVQESWNAICEELKRAELSDVMITEDGIKINLMQ